MQDLVIVKSKTVNNESVPVVFHTVEKTFGGVKDIREISRSYIFHNFQARIPLKLAEILIKEQPKEFSLATPVKDSKELKEKVEKFKENNPEKGFTCKICGKTGIKTKAGLTCHIRIKHPDKWVKGEK